MTPEPVLQVVGGEIQHRRGHLADVDHVDAACLQAARQRLRELGPGQAAVAADGHACLAERARLRADGAADQLGSLRE